MQIYTDRIHKGLDITSLSSSDIYKAIFNDKDIAVFPPQSLYMPEKSYKLLKQGEIDELSELQSLRLFLESTNCGAARLIVRTCDDSILSFADLCYSSHEFVEKFILRFGGPVGFSLSVSKLENAHDPCYLKFGNDQQIDLTVFEYGILSRYRDSFDSVSTPSDIIPYINKNTSKEEIVNIARLAHSPVWVE